MRELWICYVDLSLKCVDPVLFGFYVLLCWSSVYGGTYLLLPLSYLFIIFIYFLVYLRSCMYILLVFSQKFFKWETSPQIKFGDASLGIPVWFHSLIWRVQVFLLFIALFKLNTLNSFPFRLFPLAWSCLIYKNCHLRTCPVFVFSTLSRWISSYCFFFLWRCSPNRS